MAGKPVGTCFRAKPALNHLKKWIAYDENARKGLVVINAGAALALRERVSSLLPVGVLRIEGQFERGDLVTIAGRTAPRSVSAKSGTAPSSRGRTCGQKGKKPLVHYDYLYLD